MDGVDAIKNLFEELSLIIERIPMEAISFQMIHNDPANYCHTYNTDRGLIYKPVLIAQLEDQAEGFAMASFFGLQRFAQTLRVLREKETEGGDEAMANRLRGKIDELVLQLKTNFPEGWSSLLMASTRKVKAAREISDRDNKPGLVESLKARKSSFLESGRPSLLIQPERVGRTLKDYSEENYNDVVLCRGKLGDLEDELAVHLRLPPKYIYAGYPSNDGKAFSKKIPQAIRVLAERFKRESWKEFQARLETEMKFQILQRGCSAAILYQTSPGSGAFLNARAIPARYEVVKSSSIH